MKIKQEKLFHPSIITIETKDEYDALAFILTTFIILANKEKNAMAIEKAIKLRDLLAKHHQ